MVNLTQHVGEQTDAHARETSAQSVLNSESTLRSSCPGIFFGKCLYGRRTDYH